jgi:protein phosphatase
MGTCSKLQADYALHTLSFEVADKLLICSDGLYEYVSDDELKEILSKMTLNAAAQSLIALAKQRGGHDNISVLIVEVLPTAKIQKIKPTQKIELS